MATLVRKAERGAVLRLEAGTWSISRTIVVDGDLTLVGAGAKRTKIEGTARGALIVVRCGRVRLEKLAVARTRVAGDLLRVEGGKLILSGCVLTGASAGDQIEGAAILAVGEGAIDVQRSVLTANSHGVVAGGRSTARIRSVRCIDNAGCGIVFAQRSRGKAVNCIARGGDIGLHVRHDAYVTFQDSSASGARTAGTLVQERARARVVRCRLTRNDGNGIVAEQKARLAVVDTNASYNAGSGINLKYGVEARIERTRCDSNGRCGLTSTSVSGVCVKKCPTRQNAAYGIELLSSRRLELIANEARGNGNGGISVSDCIGSVRANRVIGNHFHGIHVAGRSRVEVSANVCERNRQVGILVTGSGHGHVALTDNICRANRFHGFDISKRSRVTCVGNLSEGNRGCGFLLSEKCQGIAERNHAVHNRMIGIEKENTSRVRCRNNQCTDNGTIHPHPARTADESRASNSPSNVTELLEG